MHHHGQYPSDPAVTKAVGALYFPARVSMCLTSDDGATRLEGHHAVDAERRFSSTQRESLCHSTGQGDVHRRSTTVGQAEDLFVGPRLQKPKQDGHAVGQRVTGGACGYRTSPVSAEREGGGGKVAGRNWRKDKEPWKAASPLAFHA